MYDASDARIFKYWPSLGIALTVQFGCDKLGFHRYEPVGTHRLLRGDAVIYVLNPARVPL